MKLNEDNTVTLSLKETQKYITKVINPEYRRLELSRKHDFLARHINNIKADIDRINQKHNEIIKVIKEQTKIPISLINQLEKTYLNLYWSLTSSAIQQTCPEEVREIESAYQLYKMLLKNRRFKEEDEQTQSLPEMPEQ